MESMTSADTDADDPLVTALVTTYNRSEDLREAVDSVRRQTYDRVELLVVDDHSDTPAEEALRDVSTDGLEAFQCVRHETNRGANAARNTGVEAASGDLIAFLDDDDEWVETKLRRQVTALARAGPEAGVVYSGTREIGGGGDEYRVPPAVTGDMTKALLCRNVVGTQSTVLVRADLAKRTPFDERFPSWADLEWYVRLSRECEFVRLPDALTTYDYTSEIRLSDDFEKTRRSYQLFVEEFRPLAAEYGPLFERKMLGWAAYRAGSSALFDGHYEHARPLLWRAVSTYPFETRFVTHLAAALGGESTHRAASRLRDLIA